MVDVKWTLEIGEPDYLDGIQSGLTISRAKYSPVAYAFDEAEARLIAAAPDLLAVVQRMYEQGGLAHGLAVHEDMRAAIAKATSQ